MLGSIPAGVTIFIYLAMEKLISMSERCWHYKLIKFVWDFDPKEFKNLCPYFWLTVASLFVVPFVLLWRGIKKVIYCIGDAISTTWDKFDNWYDKKSYNKQVLNLSKADVYFLKHRRDKNNNLISKAYQLGRYKYLDRFAQKYSDMIEDALTKLEEKFDDDRVEADFVKELDKLFTIKEKREIQEYEKAVKKEEASKRMKRRMNKVAETTHVIWTFIYTSFIVALLLLIVTLLTDVLVIALNWYVDWTTIFKCVGKIILGVICIIAASACIAAFLCYGIDFLRAENKKWWYWLILIPYMPLYFIFYKVIWEIIIYKFIYQFIIYTILWGILRGIGIGFHEFGGIFADYFDASYSDYCPGINWEDK